MDETASESNNQVNTKLSTAPYKGVRDFYPRDMAVFTYITDTMKSAAEAFGFLEYSTSVLEHAELYGSKTSDEMSRKETYTFLDRGNRLVTLRPEMTPSVTRLVAARARELPLPLKWYSIPNCFRYERPQKGRLREHWQLNCDIFGDTGVRGETEIITLAHYIMTSFGATEKQFEIQINNRAILVDILKACLEKQGFELEESELSQVMRIMDKKEKLSSQEYADELAQALSPDRAETLLREYTPDNIAALIPTLPAFQDFMELQKNLENIGIKNVRHEPSMVRGFDYYTGLVFEVFDTSGENQRSLFGGGRYDNLMDLFGANRIGAVGFGMGDLRVRDFLETHGLIPDYQAPTDLFIATIGNTFKQASLLAQELRSDDLKVSVNLSEQKLGEQLKRAAGDGIEYALIVGEDEVTSNTFKLKHLPTQNEQTVARNEVINTLFSLD